MNKILHILYSGLGGHGSVFFSLVKADKEKKFTYEAIFCGVEEMREDYGVQCRQLKIPYTSIQKKPGLDIRMYTKMYNTLRKARPSVIFLHGASFIAPVSVYKFFNPSTKLVIRDTQAHHLKTKREWSLLKLAIKICNRLVFLTKEALDGVYEKTKNKKLLKKAVVIPNGLDTDLYSPVPARDFSKMIVIGMQSRLQRIKDHTTLLKAFSLLKNKLPAQPLKLRIAGDGETRTGLEQLATELGIKPDVEFCGMLNQDELVSFMHSLDIYVHATYGETMSNSIMQAMSCQLPIVASNVWGVNNMIEHNKNGLLYTSENEQELSDWLVAVIGDNELRNRISKQARLDAESEFSLTQLFKKYSQLF